MHAKLGLDVELYKDLENKTKLATVQVWEKESQTGLVLDMRVPEERNKAKSILFESGNTFVAFESQTELFWIKQEFGMYPKIVGDAYIAALLLQEPEQSLEALSLKYLGEGKYKSLEEVTFSKMLLNDMPLTEDQYKYALKDAELAIRLEEVLAEKVSKMGKIYQLELQLQTVLVNMRFNGLRVDIDRWRIERANLVNRLESLKKELYEEANCVFKLGTGKLAPILEQVGIPNPGVKTKSGRDSFAAEVLNNLTQYPFITKLLEARHLEDVISSEKDMLDNMVNCRLHPQFRPISYTGAARIYTTKPSVNQLPVELRRAIVPDEGEKFVYVDWSGAELYYLACMAGQEDIIQEYELGHDIHRYCTSKVMSLDIKEITDELREISKVVTFSIVYGSEGHAAARKAKVSVAEAKGWVQAFLNAFPKIKLFMEKQVEKGKKTGVSLTWLGRRRIINKVWSDVETIVKEGERQLQNTPIQNGVADLQKWAMLRLDRMPGVRIVFTVFDSFLLGVKKDLDTASLINPLKDVFTFKREDKTVQFNFSIKEGYSWGELQEE